MSQVEELLAALAGTSRRTIVEALRTPLAVTDLAARTGLTRQAVQQHLAALVRAGLVRREERGRAHLYMLDARGLYALHVGLGSLAADAPDPMLPTVVAPVREGSRTAHLRGLWQLHPDRLLWVPMEGGPSWVAGRGVRCDLRLPHDPSVSHAHAILQQGRSGWTVTDLQSTNGTFVNERHVPPGTACPLVHGDLLRLGRCCLVLHVPA